MGKTGARTRALDTLLTQVGRPPTRPRPPAPRLARMPPEAAENVEALYVALGGRRGAPALGPRGWDLLAGETLVELDEEQHFNRYRATTLQTGWAEQLPWTTPYQGWCATEEDACLKAAVRQGFWTTPTSTAQFGPSAPRSDIDAPGGAARWKQRALYDAMRDSAALAGVLGYRLARLSVHDSIDGTRLNDILTGRFLTGRTPNLEAFVALLDSRTLTPSS